MAACGARTKQSGGRPCRLKAMANGKCRIHGGKSTGPRTADGRKRIGDAQRKRWERWRAENPRLFQSEISARQERRIKRAHKQLRQRTKLQEEARAWVAQWKASRSPASTTQPAFMEFAIARGHQQQVAQPPPPLTPEQRALADKLLDDWAAKARQISAPPAEQIERQPVHRIKRLEYEDRRQAENEHGRDLIRRYGLGKQRPVVQGLSLRKKRR